MIRLKMSEILISTSVKEQNNKQFNLKKQVQMNHEN